MDISFAWRKFQKSIAAVSVATIFASFISFSGVAQAGTTFSDVPDDHYAAEAIEALAGDGVIGGYGNGKFGPNDKMTRAQLAKVIVGAFDLDTSAAASYDAGFVDMPGGDLDLYVKAAAQLGVMTGYADGSHRFGSNDSVERQDLAVVLHRVLGLTEMTDEGPHFPDVDEGSYYYGAVETMWWYQVVNGYANGKFGTGDDVIRADATLMIYRATGDLTLREVTDDGNTDEPTSSDGTLVVELSEDTPEGMTVPNKANSVALATWDFSAEGDDVELESLVLHLATISNMASDHSVYLYEGSERLTSAASVNSTTREVTFNNVNLDIDKGDTRTLTVRMDVGNSTSNREIGFEIEEADAVGTNASDVEGDFPLEGETFEVDGSTNAGTITISKNGTITNPKVGETDATIAKFTLAASTEAAAVQELGLYIDGTVATTDLENFKLYRTGDTEPLAEADAVDSRDVVRFVLDGDYDSDSTECSDDGYCIEKGASRTFYVTADFNTGRSGDTTKVYVDEDTDVLAVGSLYHFGMSVTNSDYDATADSCASGSSADCSFSTLQGGDITISKHNISNTNLAVNQEDAKILDFTITSQSDVTFNNFVLQLQTGTTAEATSTDAGLWKDSDDSSNFTDIRIKEVGGSFTYGPIDANQLLSGTVGSGVALADGTDTSATHYIFTDDLTVKAGKARHFEVYVDVENNSALANETLTASVVINSSYPEIKDVNNKVLTNSSSLVPTATFSGDQFTVKATSLAVVLNTGVGSATRVIDSTDAVLGAFSLTSGDASDTTITSLKVTGYYDTDSSGTFTAGGTFKSIVPTLRLYVGSVAEENQVGASDGADSNGEATFNDLDWTIEHGTTEVVYVTGDIDNNSTYDGYRVKVDIADVSADVTAEDDRGNTVSSTSSDTPNGGTADSNVRVTISAGGTLTVDVPSSTPSSQIVVAGTSGNEFAQLKFTATRESFKVSKLALKNAYTSTVGDYDDNVNAVKVTYFTNEAQTQSNTVTCSSSATAGVYTCNFPSGKELIVPDPNLAGINDYSVVTVKADLNSIQDDQADEGDRPSFTLSLTADFEGRGLSSNKLIEDSGTYDLTINKNGNTILSIYSNAASGFDDAQLAAAISSTSATSITVDDGTTDAGDANLVGAFLCIDDSSADGSCGAGEEQLYVTAVTDGASSDTLTVVRGVNGTAGATHSDDATVLVLLPTGVLATNYMQVQATDVDLTIAASSRTGSENSSEAIMTFTATANSAKVAKIRAALGAGDASYGEENAAPTALTAGPSSVTRVSSTPTPVAGTYAVKIVDATALASGDGGSLDAGSAGLLDDYSYASLWLYINDASSNDSLTGAQVLLGTGTAATAFQQTSAIGSSTAITEGAWMFFSDIAIPSGTDSSDQYFGVRLGAAMTDATDYVAFDDVRFYNERINVDLTINEDWASVSPTVAYLTQNGITVADGYVDFDGAVGNRTGQIVFTPSGTRGDIELDGAETMVVLMDTATAITEDSSATENLTARIDMGNVSTTGDFWWYDGEDVLNFLGVNTTDKVSVTSQY